MLIRHSKKSPNGCSRESLRKRSILNRMLLSVAGGITITASLAIMVLNHQAVVTLGIRAMAIRAMEIRAMETPLITGGITAPIRLLAPARVRCAATHVMGQDTLPIIVQIDNTVLSKIKVFL